MTDQLLDRLAREELKKLDEDLFDARTENNRLRDELARANREIGCLRDRCSELQDDLFEVHQQLAAETGEDLR